MGKRPFSPTEFSAAVSAAKENPALARAMELLGISWDAMGIPNLTRYRASSVGSSMSLL